MPSPPSSYHRYGAGPRVYTRDEVDDDLCWPLEMSVYALLRLFEDCTRYGVRGLSGVRYCHLKQGVFQRAVMEVLQRRRPR